MPTEKSAMTIPPRLLQMLRPSEIYGLLAESAKQWSSRRASSKGAALSLYMVFSLAPMLILVIAVAGVFFGEEAVRSDLFPPVLALTGDRERKSVWQGKGFQYV